MNLKRLLHKSVREELDKADDWDLVAGSKHIKIMIGGHLATIWPRNGGSEGGPHQTRNTISYIRQARRSSHVPCH